MTTGLRVLNIEDSEDDALLLARLLSQAGYQVTLERVDSQEAFEASLALEWDVVVADYNLPGFSAPRAVALLQERRPDLPVVIISGIVSDDVMAMSNKGPVREYLSKDDLPRLVRAIGLAAGVIPPADRPAANLALCHEYLNLPEPNPAKAASHGERALTGAEELGLHHILSLAALYLSVCYSRLGWWQRAEAILKRFDAVSYARAIAWFRDREMTTPAREVAALLDRIKSAGAVGGQIPADSDGDDFTVMLDRAEYHLLGGNVAQAVKESLAALQAAGTDSMRCYHCYCLLMRCAHFQRHPKDALNFAISARIMALDAQRYDLAFQTLQAFEELRRDLGPLSQEFMTELTQEYRAMNVDLSRYLPGDALNRS